MIRNLTPHAVVIHPLVDPAIDTAVARRTIPSEGEARLTSVARRCGRDHDGVPLVEVAFGDVTGLPDPVDGVLLIVSGMVLDRVADVWFEWADRGGPGRAPRTPFDLAAPGELVRHPTTGQPIGCRGLRILPAEPVDLAALVARLGDSVDAIRATLVAGGYRGRREASGLCPIARYLLASGAIMPDVNRDELWAQNAGGDIATPWMVRDFVKAFDNGDFPELIEEPKESP